MNWCNLSYDNIISQSFFLEANNDLHVSTYLYLLLLIWPKSLRPCYFLSCTESEKNFNAVKSRMHGELN